MSDDGVVYLIQGTRHWVVLCVSILSLRDHFDGPVCVLFGDASGEEIADRLCEDGRLNVTARPISGGMKGRRNAGYANKPRVIYDSPFDRSVFLDADTVVCGDISPLFDHDGSKVVFTEFCQWTTAGSKMRQRIRKWEKKAPEEVEASLSVPYRALNTGVFGFGSSSDQFADAWLEMTHRNISFMCDEIAAQLLLPGWQSSIIIMDDRFNCSPIHSKQQDRARVFHFHGRKHVKNERTRSLWMPIFNRALSIDLAGIRSWVPAGDRRLEEHLSHQES